jgi:hypothetical protein
MDRLWLRRRTSTHCVRLLLCSFGYYATAIEKEASSSFTYPVLQRRRNSQPLNVAHKKDPRLRVSSFRGGFVWAEAGTN